MSTAALRFKQAIAKQLSSLTQCSEPLLLDLIRVPKKSRDGQFTLSLPQLGAALRQQSNNSNSSTPNAVQDPTAWSKEIASKFIPDQMIADATAQGPTLQFRVANTEFMKQVLTHVYNEHSTYGWAHAPQHNQTVVIDYSSPNIAKPFHAGHLRSTILGNFAKRIHEIMGYRVVGVNYLGDWGKQYGLLAVGFERYGDQDKLMHDPIHHLYEVYVRINQEAKHDPTVDQQANAYFKRMEQGDTDALALWRRLRDMSIESYKSIYGRLGVSFEVYSGESQVESYIPKVNALLREKGLVETTQDGASAIDLEQYSLGKAIVQRADGTSLYLTRDLACLMMRQELYGFDKALYVVGSEQQGYFRQVFKLGEMLFGFKNLQHVSFGRIQGMSTRQGTAVFLEDILNTAQEQILQYMEKEKSHVKDRQEMTTVSDQLGISAILVQDMKSKRNKDYSFSWERMTDAKGDTGVFLQYAHARACGIERNADAAVIPTPDFGLLKEPEALDLAQLISQFPEMVESSFNSLEPCTIVNYLFKLSHATSAATQVLWVKGQEPELAAARMLLFWAARTTLFNGLSLLGIKPIERM
ncbi:arginyl-trna synthetase [Lichtheimia corymbifera JMRC:FSU:9682]|uniref:arginine--tRNA ligase n=1 Tax=Lichtheimia corymbifera JMRC:FSU:9682 TaxID=1263082 RepID=A0A068RG47_9FUNG|nr:arginyl-trna synthetase [Lichtheimia corymbifera JMRC:FSU:9682]